MKDKKIYPQILKHIDNVIAFSKQISYKEFIESPIIISACAFEICQISESTIKLSDEEKARQKNIPWLAIKGLRNRIVHNYSNLDIETLYYTITDAIPTLKIDIQKAMERL